jgi:hypothetical protein
MYRGVLSDWQPGRKLPKLAQLLTIINIIFSGQQPEQSRCIIHGHAARV